MGPRRQREEVAPPKVEKGRKAQRRGKPQGRLEEQEQGDGHRLRADKRSELDGQITWNTNNIWS